MNEQIKRIKELLDELDIRPNITHDEIIEMLYDCSFNDIERTLWKFYCFASDVKEVFEVFKE